MRQGIEQGLVDLVVSGDITAQRAAEKLGISKEALEEKLLMVHK